MSDEIKFIDNGSQTPKLNEDTKIKEIKPIENIKKEEKTTSTEKVILPSWNIEPPVEIQRSIE